MVARRNILVLTSPIKSKEEDDWSESATVVDAGKFEEWIKEHPNAVVLMHARWCSFCREYMPRFNNIAQELKRRKPDAALSFACVEVGEDNEQQNKLKKMYGIKSFPTVLLFRDGKFKQLESDRASARAIFTEWRDSTID